MDFELTPEQEKLRGTARELADSVFAGRAARWDAAEDYPWDNINDLVTAGFMGMTVPSTYGGPDRPLLDVVLVVEEIARACGVTARIVVEGNLGAVGALRAYGTDAQQRRWFPWVLEGEKPAIGITEPAAGSAATDLQTRADETADGFALTGQKRWITGAGTSRLYLVYARFGGRPGSAAFSSSVARRGSRSAGASRRWGCAEFPRASCTSSAVRWAARTCSWGRGTASRSS
jgi:3-sulfinopropanoyl-CoA desulfinase